MLLSQAPQPTTHHHLQRDFSVGDARTRSMNSAELRGVSHAATMARWREVSRTATWSLSMSPPTWSAWSLAVDDRAARRLPNEG